MAFDIKKDVLKATIGFEGIVAEVCELMVGIEYKLVCEAGRLDAPGKPILFATTEEFLRNFGIESLEDLPVVNPEKIEDFKNEAEEEIQMKLDLSE